MREDAAPQELGILQVHSTTEADEVHTLPRLQPATVTLDRGDGHPGPQVKDRPKKRHSPRYPRPRVLRVKMRPSEVVGMGDGVTEPGGATEGRAFEPGVAGEGRTIAPPPRRHSGIG